MVPSLLMPILPFDAMIAGVDVGDEAFEAVGDEFDRPLAAASTSATDGHLVGIGVHLDAERARRHPW